MIQNSDYSITLEFKERQELDAILHLAEMDLRGEIAREDYLSKHNEYHARDWAKYQERLREKLAQVKAFRRKIKINYRARS